MLAGKSFFDVILDFFGDSEIELDVKNDDAKINVKKQQQDVAVEYEAGDVKLRVKTGKKKPEQPSFGDVDQSV